MKDLKTILTSETPGQLMKRYSLPCILSLLVAALYNIVDQIFIANADYLGSFGNSANTVVYPLTVAALSLAVMIGDGCCAYVSIASGAGRHENAKTAVANALGLTAAVSIVLMFLYLRFADPILRAFGASVSETTYDMARSYFFWISLGIPFYMFGQAANPIIRSDGSPRFAMFATVTGCLLNVVLDPIFIYPMHMGMAGAAIATILGQIVTAVLSFLYLRHMNNTPLDRESFTPSFAIIKQMLALGMTSFLSQISIVASMFVVQNRILTYGALDPIFSNSAYAQIPMAVLGIVMKVFQIVISIAVGIAAGMIPVIGYNIGAGENKRASQMFKLILKTEFLAGLAAWFVVEFFPDKLIALFGAAGESSYYTSFAVHSFRTYLLFLPLAAVNKGVFISMQSLGKAKESTLLSLFREIVLGCGLAWVLPYALGLDGVLWSMPASDLLAGIAALFLIQRTLRELNGKTETAMAR